MSIDVQCRCGKTLRAQARLAGKQVRCPACQAAVVIPAEKGPDARVSSEDRRAEVIMAVVVDEQASSAFGDPAVSPQAAFAHGAGPAGSKSSVPVWAFVIAGVLAVMVIACGGIGVFAYLALSRTVNTMQIATGADELPQAAADYASERKNFRTKLRRRGSAPQDWEPLHTPQGASRISYDSGGQTLAAFVDAPPSDNRPRPGLVFLHGGFAFGDGDWEMAQPFRNAGYVVMIPILRGENGQPGEFTLFFDEVDDVLAATDAFAELPYVDEERLFVVGHSAGGTLAALAAMASDRFSAAASYSGSMDQRVNQDIAPYDIADIEETKIRSPVAYAHSFKCPVRLYYGSSEPWLAAMTQTTVSRARRQGLNVQAHVAPGDHFTSVRPAIDSSIAFFRTLQLQRLRTPPGTARLGQSFGGQTDSPTAQNFGMGGLGSEAGAAPTTQTGNLSFRKHRSISGQFEIDVPGIPRMQPSVWHNTPAGIMSVITEHFRQGDVQCHVTSGRIPPARGEDLPERMLEWNARRYADELAAPASDSPAEHEDIHYEDHPGRAARYELSSGGSHQVRSYVIGGMFYQLVWIAPDAQGEAAAKRFFDSFQIEGAIRPRLTLPELPKIPSPPTISLPPTISPP